ncbi:MAG: sigma-54 dependent transcriptional regulator [Chloroflexota bacterium]
MNRPVKVLVVDDEASIRESLQEWLKGIGYDVAIAEDGARALELAARDEPDVVIADLVMPGIDGIELTRRLKDSCPDADVIVVTAFASVATAIEAIKQGAYDYVEKPFCPERLELVIKKVIEHQQVVKENLSLRQKLDSQYRFENIIAKSHRMQQVFEVVRVVAKSNATVLITGDSGTGKELIARAVHNLSLRRGKPFVAVSCAALPESLLESALFGHERGAFTGATSQKKGKFEFAHGGTLFLDEIGDISPNVQVHLLRVIEEKEFTRVGGNEPIKVDVRLISATNKDLKKAMEEGKFREDLFYRLNVVGIHLPPLRERKEDIPPLSEYFLRKFAMENHKDIKDFTPEARELLLKYEWPGNIRELENAIERAVILSRGEFITPAEFPGIGVTAASASSLAGKNLREVEKECITSTLRQTGGNVSEAARILGITRMTLYNKLKEYGLSVNKTDKT